MNLDSQDNRKIEPAVRRSWRQWMWFDQTMPNDLVEQLWANPAALLADGRAFKSDQIRTIVRLRWNSQDYILKHYREPTWPRKLLQTIRRPRAWKTLQIAHQFADRAIATPRPVACLSHRLGPFSGTSYLLYPFLEGETLRTCFNDEQRCTTSFADKVSQQMVELWVRLTQLKASLADTKFENFIVSPDDRLWVIDLDDARFHRTGILLHRRYRRGWRLLNKWAERSKCVDEQFVQDIQQRVAQTLEQPAQKKAS